MNGTPEVWHAEPDPSDGSSSRRRHVLGHGPRIVLSLALAAALLGYVLPHVVGTTLRDVGAALALVTPAETVLLVVLWASGLFVYSFVLTAALPGLSRNRALNLNLTGSAVANVLPFGGAAGMSLNYLMIRSWGFSTSGFSAYTLVTNVWSVLLKLALPAVALGALFVSGEHVNDSVRWTGAVAGAALGLLVLVLVAALSTPAAAERATGVVAPAVARVSRVVRRPVDRGTVARVLLDFRDRVAGLVEERWLQLSVGTIGYGLLQALLLWACLEAVGARLSPVVVLAAYAVDRVMSMVFLTPGGAGFAEAGTAAVLVALGGAPAAMAAGVLLYRGFTFALEIPVGGVWLGGWLVARRRRTAADTRRVAADASRDARDRRPTTRILHVTDYYRPKVGGIEMFVEELAARQAAVGHDVTVLTPAREAVGVATTGPVEVIRAPSWSPVPLPILPRGLDLSSYDVVHVHLSVACPFSTRVAQSAAGLGVPVVATVHSLWTGREGWVRIIGAIAGWDAWPMRWTAVSAAAAAAMRGPLGEDTRVDVVPNAVDVGWWSACAPLEDASRPITFVSVMRLTGRKRPLALLEAFAAARRAVPQDTPLRLVVVGEGPLERKVRARITALGLDECVELTGGLSRDAIRELYRSADAYVAPSHQESFGIAALEARAARLPVVAMTSGGVGEFVRDGTEGLLCADDDELGEALRTLAVDPALRRRISDHNRSHPPAMDWEQALDGFQTAYAGAAASTRERAADLLPADLGSPSTAR